MRTLAAAYLTAAKAAGRYPDVSIVIGDDDLTITGSKEIISVQITKGATSKPSSFQTAEAVGSVGTITIDRRTLAAADEALIESGAAVVVSAVFRNGSGAVVASAVIYTGIITAYNDQDMVKGVISITDIMANAGIDYNPEGLDYDDAYIADVMEDALDLSDIPLGSLALDVNPFINDAPYKAEEPVGEGMRGAPYSCREILAAVAGMNLSCMFIDAEGYPKLYAYGAANTTAVNAAILTELKTTRETYGLDQIKCFKTAEKMAKTAANYRVLPYAPRLPYLPPLERDTIWYSEIQDIKDRVLHWDWMTATATIQGVGEVELGDRIQFTVSGNTIKMFVTGIVYKFENAHFSETLYSFAQTEQEYKMSPQGATNVTTGAKGDAGVQTYYSDTDPALTKTIKANDLWYVWDSSSSKKVTAIKRRKLVTPASGQSEAVYDWEVVGNVGGGVGEDLGNGDIRFNDSTNTVTSSNGKNTLFGGSNSMTSCFESIVGGYNNSLTSCDYSWVWGSYNTVSVRYGAVFGEENTVNGSSNRGLTCGNGNRVTNGSDDDLVTGVGNTLNNTRRCVVAGMSATYNNSTDSMMIAEGSQTITNLEKCYFVGENNSGAAFDASGARFAFVKDRAFKFIVDSYGNVTAAAYNTNGADFPEFFEWVDGNPDKEDRMGLLVMNANGKIEPAVGEFFIGAVSARGSVIGNAYENHWRGKYLTDVYGRVLKDEDGNEMISPEFDPDREYVPRSQRPEWAAVGLVGRIIIQDDGTCEPDDYVFARNGVGTKAPCVTRAVVLQRLDANHVEILMK